MMPVDGPTRYLADLLADLGERPIVGNAGSDMFIGPFVFRSDSLAAFGSTTVQTTILDLRLGANRIDPQLNQIEANNNNPEIGLIVTSVRVALLDVAEWSRENIAELQNRLFLRWQRGESTRYFPLFGAVGTADVGGVSNVGGASFQARQTPGFIAPWLVANLKTDQMSVITVPGAGGAIAPANPCRVHVLVGGVAMATSRMKAREPGCTRSIEPGSSAQIRAVTMPLRNAPGGGE